MPRLHQDENGNFFIVQHTSVGGTVPEFTKYGVSEVAIQLLLDLGVGDGSSISHEVFHRLRESGHIRAGTSHLYSKEDVVNQQVSHKRICDFFNGCTGKEELHEQLMEQFRKHVLLTLNSIQNVFLRQQMFLFVGERLSGQAHLKAAEELFLEKTPSQWKRDVLVALGRAGEQQDAVLEGGEQNSAPRQEQPTVEAETGQIAESKSHPVEEKEADDDLVELRSLARLPQEVRKWLFNTYASYPGVKISESTDPATGEITICIDGLPQGLAEAMTNALLRATPKKKRKRRRRLRFQREQQERSFGLNVPIGGQPGWRRKIRRP
jgi:hypothetical protein